MADADYKIYMEKVLMNAVGIEKIYYLSQGEEVHSVNKINLSIEEGQFVVIMGDSGSGKSTLLYLLSGLEPVTSGEIKIDLHQIDKMNEAELAIFRRKQIGFVFQNINLVPNLTMLENIMLPGLLLTKNANEVLKRAEKLLEKMNLADQINKLPSQMSGGQQQRGAIARALINSPKIVFADEPTGSLNSANGKAVIETLMELNAEGQTIIMVTHDYKMAAYGDRVLYIRDGMILSEKDNHKEDILEKKEAELLAWLGESGW